MSTSKLLPPTPLTHGSNSKTFTQPPLDGSLSIAEVFDYHAHNSPEHPIFIYEDEPGKIETIYWPQLVHATARVASLIRSYNVPSEAPATKVIAVLALADTITYFTLIHGIIRAGYVPFPLSPRNSPEAIAHLLIKSRATHMLVSGDPSMQGLSAGSLKRLAADEGSIKVERLSVPFFADLYAPFDEKKESLESPEKVDLDATCLMLHSSGAFFYVFSRSYSLLITSSQEVHLSQNQSLLRTAYWSNG